MTTRADIAELLRRAQAIRAELPSSGGVAVDSVASTELKWAAEKLGTPEVVERVIRVCDTWTAVSAAHIAGIATIVEHGDGAELAVFPLARAAIEHCAAAQWVLDPSVETESRAARAALAHDRANEAAVRAVRRLLGTRDHQVFREKRQRLEVERTRIATQFPNDDRGLELRTNVPEGIVAGERHPKPSDLVSRLSEDETYLGAYDYLCAVATHPGLLVLEFAKAAPSGGGAFIISDEFVERLTVSTVAPFCQAVARYVTYCGWDRSSVDQLAAQTRRIASAAGM